MYLAALVFVGGGFGSVLRYGLSLGVLRLGWTGFPVATLAVNIMGGFLMGLLAGWFAFRGGGPQAWRLFLTTGLMGGFTTFSTFSLETVLLFEEGRVGVAAAYVGLSVALSVLGLAGGLALVRALV
jgi:CrcB protein